MRLSTWSTAALAVSFAAGCTSPLGPSPTSSPSAAVPTLPTSNQSSAAPSTPSPGPVATLRDSDLQPDTIARVVTNNLRVRSEPGVSDTSIKFEPLLDADVLAYVVDGPVAASGYDWYLIEPLDPSGRDDPGMPSGWVAGAAPTGEPWLVTEPFECAANKGDVAPWPVLRVESPRAPFYLGLYCFGRQKLTFTARLGISDVPCETDAPWVTNPDWFDNCRQDPHYLWADTYGSRPAFAPGIDLSFASSPDGPPFVEVAGQFDHEAARECRAVRTDDGEPYLGALAPHPKLVVARCRAQFVVTGMRELSERLDLIQAGSYSCEGGALAGYGSAGDGFVIVNVNGPGDLIAEVALRGGLPNKTYTVQLIQSKGLGGSIDDCYVEDATLVTDSVGAGRASVHEARHSGVVGVWVYVLHLGDNGPSDLHGTRLVPIADFSS